MISSIIMGCFFSQNTWRIKNLPKKWLMTDSMNVPFLQSMPFGSQTCLQLKYCRFQKAVTRWCVNKQTNPYKTPHKTKRTARSVLPLLSSVEQLCRLSFKIYYFLTCVEMWPILSSFASMRTAQKKRYRFQMKSYTHELIHTFEVICMR